VSEFSKESLFYSPVMQAPCALPWDLGATNFALLVGFAKENFRQLQVKSSILFYYTVIFFPCLYRGGHILAAHAWFLSGKY